VKLLLGAKADPNEIAFRSRPLIFETLVSTPTILEAFLEGGANPNVRYQANDNNNPSPLDIVVEAGKTSQVELLLTHGADVNSAKKNGWTPLHDAAWQGLKPIVELLIKAEARVNAQDNEGRTALYLAISAHHHDVAELLLKSNADPNIRDKNGQTPLDIAKAAGNGPRPFPAKPFTVIPGNVTAGQPSSDSSAPADLLRKHGALDDLPRLDRLEVRRPSANLSRTVFLKGNNDWDQFSLVEVIARHYNLLSSHTSGNWQEATADLRSLWQGGQIVGQEMLPFPDFEHLLIQRPAANGKSWAAIPVKLQDLLDSGDCSRDQQLQWGDVLEVPEADHPVANPWQGLSDPAAQNLIKCLSRNVTVVIKGVKTDIKLAPRYELAYRSNENHRILRASFMLRSVLDQFKLIRFSSDLTHVRVSRHDAVSGKDLAWTLDCSNASDPPAFWLRDGDTIEIPDRT
jgi:hypothetical protein